MAEKAITKKEKKGINKTEITEKTTKITFNILAIFCLVLFSIAIVSKEFQNDTFYTIKIGQLIRTNGIDYKDHFSWISDLPYTYPHWLYDVMISIIYDHMGGFTGVYISTMVFSAIMAICLYFTNKKISKNSLISFLMAWVQMYLLKPYITARAQLVTFILFILTVFFIEKFLEKPKPIYAIILIIIPTLIANLHAAVFPFYFILYLPYIGEYLIRLLIDFNLFHKLRITLIKDKINFTNKKLKKANEKDAKKYQKQLTNLNIELDEANKSLEKFANKEKEKLANPYKLEIERNDNVKKLILIMILCAFTGFLTPLKGAPYTYTWKTAKGSSLQNINEHLPLTLINNKPLIVFLTIAFILPMFTKIKVKLRDVFFFSGLLLLAFMSRRQTSMLVIFGGFALGRVVAELVKKYDSTGTKEMIKYMTSYLGETLSILLFIVIAYAYYKPNFKTEYVSKNSYPTEAVKWIKENLDYTSDDFKIFNEYNYGSYMLMNDVPVFIDSRCDLYMPEFNGEYDKEKKKYEGQNIFQDFMNIVSITTDFDKKFEEYDIKYVMTKPNSKLAMLIEKEPENYKEIYKDNSFKIYERLK